MTCLRLAAVLAAATALAGCSQDLSRTFGFTHDAPDEFTVTTRAPLSMPPSYTLRPPRPGAPRPQEVSERQKAEQALVPEQALGAQSAPSAPSPGQEALLSQAGPAAPKDIRAEVDQEAAADAPGQSFTDKLLFWRTPPQPGIVVDPTKEAQRLRQNAALGRSVEDGDTPIIQPKQKGLLEGLF
ncbi:MAG: DUF3035 domain-containing protein [Proteobacteria bacterium]|nr:DUF3035 domain-containing protein [Pseudomonadota bacterium]